ncbi:MAG: hypothetical protein IJF34_12905, partial [Clostridia bacterium]|nr:hypothetical protein [Clostridia bacterium]
PYYPSVGVADSSPDFIRQRRMRGANGRRTCGTSAGRETRSLLPSPSRLRRATSPKGRGKVRRTCGAGGGCEKEGAHP